MSMDIEEQLEVRAPVERVWRFLIDPEQVVTCLPGAELTKVEDARTFLGQMKVKVGPVTVSYLGRVKLTDVDEAAHVVRMSGEGTEKGGAGSAKMTMESTLTATPTGCLVVVKSKVDLAGKIVQFGRGMVKGVAGQMFKQFGQNLRAVLEAKEEPAAEAAAVAAASGAATGAAAATAGTPAKGLESESRSESGSGSASGSGSGSGSAPGSASAYLSDSASGSATAPFRIPPHNSEKPTAPLAVRRHTAEPVRIIPMILNVLFEPFRRFFRRLFHRLFGRR